MLSTIKIFFCFFFIHSVTLGLRSSSPHVSSTYPFIILPFILPFGFYKYFKYSRDLALKLVSKAISTWRQKRNFIQIIGFCYASEEDEKSVCWLFSWTTSISSFINRPTPVVEQIIISITANLIPGIDIQLLRDCQSWKEIAL